MDTELARLVLKRIENDPALFDMLEWGSQTDCGTAACLAGHTLLAAGYQFVPLFGRRGFYACPLDIRSVSAYHEARDLLGLPEEDARELFFMNDNAAAIARFRELIEQSETGE